MWYKISNAENLELFLKYMRHFHDSCITEMHYTSGAYCDKQAMYPINDCRCLTVIIQSGWRDVEMKFEGLVSLRMFPPDEKYTCEILDTNVFLENGLIYWCNSADLDPLNSEIDWGTTICATSLSWRILRDDERR